MLQTHCDVLQQLRGAAGAAAAGAAAVAAHPDLPAAAANAAVMGLAVALGAATSVGGAVVIALTLPAAGLTGATTACLQAGTFALASYFPPRYMQVRKHHVDATANDDCTAGSSGRRAAAALGSPPAITVCESAQAILEGQAVATTGNCAASSASLSCCS